MRYNRTLFWLSGFVIFLFSGTIVHHTKPLSPSATTAVSPQDSFNFQFGVYSKIIKLSGAQDFLSLLTSIARRRHHHRRRQKEKCDPAKWASRLIQDYNVSQVFTVDLKGSCANFSSVQKAVDAVPESSSETTLIIIDSGTYRSFSLFNILLVNSQCINKSIPSVFFVFFSLPFIC